MLPVLASQSVRIGKVSAENKALKRPFPRFSDPVDRGENWFKLRQELIGLAFHDPHWGSSPPRRNFNKDQRSARAFQPQFPSRATIILIMNEHEHNQTMASEELYEQWENGTTPILEAAAVPVLASE